MEVEINPSVVAIAVSTSYPKWYQGKLRSLKHTDKIRGDLALELFKKSITFGYQIVVVDTLSSKTFRHQLYLIKDLNLIKKHVKTKRSPGRRLAFKVASELKDVKTIIYTDPEKVSLIDFIPAVVKPILENKADIVIPKRNPDLFKSTYPPYQYESETEGNKLYNEQLRATNLLSAQSPDLDMFFGPRAFKNDPKILRLFTKKFVFRARERKLLSSLEFDVEDYSNAIFFPVISALKKKLRIESIEVRFSYPKIQKDNEEIGSKELFIEKRRAQRMSILIELMYFINSLEK